MRASLRKIPLWLGVTLLGGVVFGLVMGLYTKHDGGSTGFAVVGGVISGLGFGLLMALTFRKLIQRWEEAMGDTPASVRRAAHWALWRWRPVPADPEVRVAAIKLAEYRLDQLRRWRTLSLSFFALLLALYVYLLIADFSPWRILFVLLGLFFIGQQFYVPKVLRSRIDVLKAA